MTSKHGLSTAVKIVSSLAADVTWTLQWLKICGTEPWPLWSMSQVYVQNDRLISSYFQTTIFFQVKVWCSSWDWSHGRWFPLSPDPVLLLSEGDPLSVRIGTARATAVDHGGFGHAIFGVINTIVFFYNVCHLLSLNQTRIGCMEKYGKKWKNLDDRKPFRPILDVRFLFGVKSPADVRSNEVPETWDGPRFQPAPEVGAGYRRFITPSAMSICIYKYVCIIIFIFFGYNIYIYIWCIHHKLPSLELQTNLANYGAPPCNNQQVRIHQRKRNGNLPEICFFRLAGYILRGQGP